MPRDPMQTLHRVRGLGSAVSGLSALEIVSSRAFARHAHDEFGIGIVVAGAQDSLSGRGQVQAVAGDVITVNPGELHDGRPVDGAARHWRIVYLAPHLLADLAGVAAPAAFAFTQPVVRDRPLAVAVNRLFGRLVLAAGRPGGWTVAGPDRLAIEEALVAVIDLGRGGRSSPGAADTAGVLCCCRSDDGPGGRPGGRSADAPASIAQARARLDDDPATPVSLAELAAGAGLSRFAFLRAFQRAVGATPQAYRRQAQARLARRLLLAGMPLAEAAAAAGFADQSHLTRVFGQQYGITPGRMRA